ncbi:hypothetical protein C0J52_22663 [Blattella germanica]|nr:hypothetical protein C0J52_22663 [Blattella germanica]
MNYQIKYKPMYMDIVHPCRIEQSTQSIMGNSVQPTQVFMWMEQSLRGVWKNGRINRSVCFTTERFFLQGENAARGVA